jgi:glycosyltransferase involved in cell wall biosynthesis
VKGSGKENQTLAICFGQFGPYHHARVAALQEAAKDQKTKRPNDQETRVVPVQIAAATTTYAWNEPGGVIPTPQAKASPPLAEGLRTLCEGTDEAASPLGVFLKARKLFREEKVDVAFLPSYSPARFFALFAAAKSLGIRTVMMNESHAGTEQAIGWKRWIKCQIVKRFDAAFVGGEPHKRHFASLGIPADKIFTGYDAVDNALFAARADEMRSMEHGARRVEQDESSKDQETKRQSVRDAYGLPERYFLSLGRMVEKKNLATLVAAYAKFCDGWRVASDESARRAPVSLVFVGSGELEGALREQARGLGLRVVDRTDWRVEKTGHGFTRINADKSERLAADRTKGNAASSVTRAGCGLSPETTSGEDAAAMKTRDLLPATHHEENRGTVFFYGFRQIEENPVFYALAEAFVLPSLKEEWGLVVNEAMAAGLPVIVSRTAGCAEDLVPASGQVTGGEWRVTSKNADDCKLVADDSLEQRSNGFVFDPKSSDALSEALRRIEAAGTTDGGDAAATLNAEMGRWSREIVAKFSCENFARQALRAAEAACARATRRK